MVNTIPKTERRPRQWAAYRIEGKYYEIKPYHTVHGSSIHRLAARLSGLPGKDRRRGARFPAGIFGRLAWQ